MSKIKQNRLDAFLKKQSLLNDLSSNTNTNNKKI